jgi:hypothetical protein
MPITVMAPNGNRAAPYRVEGRAGQARDRAAYLSAPTGRRHR